MMQFVLRDFQNCDFKLHLNEPDGTVLRVEQFGVTLLTHKLHDIRNVCKFLFFWVK